MRSSSSLVLVLVLVAGCNNKTNSLIDRLRAGPDQPGAQDALTELGTQADRDAKLLSKLLVLGEDCRNAADLAGYYMRTGPEKDHAMNTLLEALPQTAGACSMSVLASLLIECQRDDEEGQKTCTDTREKILDGRLRDEQAGALAEHWKTLGTDKLVGMLDLRHCKNQPVHTQNLLRVIDRMNDRGDAVVLRGFDAVSTEPLACAFTVKLGERGRRILEVMGNDQKYAAPFKTCSQAMAQFKAAHPDGGSK